MSPALSVVIAALLLAGNALFVATEFALMAARRTQIEVAAAAGSRAARTTLGAMDELSYVIATAQLGVTACSLGLGAVAEPFALDVLAPATSALGLSEAASHITAYAAALVAVIYLHVVFGEMVPKNLSLAAADRAAIILGPPMMALVRAIRPLASGLDSLANAVIRLLRVKPRNELNSTYTREQVSALVDESLEEGLIEAEEHERLAGAIDFTGRTVSEVMLPLSQVATIPRGSRASEVEKACAETGFSRFPVRDDDGSLVGYLHIKDVLDPGDPHGRAKLVDDQHIRPFATVRSGTSLVEALTTLQRRRAHLGLVRDAAGAPVGVVMLEDLIEELVGEIRDASHAG